MRQVSEMSVGLGDRDVLDRNERFAEKDPGAHQAGVLDGDDQEGVPESGGFMMEKTVKRTS